MAIVLITGGAGFIGSNLAAALLAKGTRRVVVCDRFGATEKWRNLAHHAVWDVVMPEKLCEWLKEYGKEVDTVFHIGGASSTTEKNADAAIDGNFTQSLKLWRWCRDHNARFIYTSSVATYGSGEKGFDDNNSLDYLRSLIPLNAYGWSKHLFDMHVMSEVAAGDPTPPQWVGLKLFNVYGPNEYHKEAQRSVISQMAPHAIQGGSVKLFRSNNPKYADGAQMRDVIYVKDVVDVMLWLMENPQVSGIYNLGTGKARTFADMAQSVFRALGKEPRIHYIDMPEEIVQKYQYFTEARMDRLRAAGYGRAFTSLEDGIKDYVQGYLLKDDPYL